MTGDRGIPVLPQAFEKVKYKGKGHELSDLNKMMGVMEHWAHRLYPKMPFDELIERVERLGQKKDVQVIAKLLFISFTMRQLGEVIFFKEESPTFRKGENFVDKKIRKFAVSVYDISI